jgi:peptidoglycan/LPS O-acetylase OafA/YrhL
MRRLRLLAALAVVVGHGFVLLDAGPTPRLGGIPLHTLGLYVFFTISGYLITWSWDRMPTLVGFLQNRALRILPGLAATVIASVIIVGPLVSTLPLVEYFANPGTWRYLSGLLLVPQYELPGTFSGHHLTTVNGSLWTLGIEAACYLATAILGLTLRRFAWIGALVVGTVAVIIAFQPTAAPLSDLRPVGAVCAYFAIGALAHHAGAARWRIPVPAAVIATAAWLIVGAHQPETGTALGLLAVPLAVLTIATRSVDRSGASDLSYGVYLWGYPVQQLVIDVNPQLPGMFSIAVTVALTLGLAALSWRYVESPALGLKRTSSRVRTVRLGGQPRISTV